MDKPRETSKAVSNIVPSEELKPAPESAKNSSIIGSSVQTRGIVLGLPSFGSDRAKNNNFPWKPAEIYNKNSGERKPELLKENYLLRSHEKPKDPASSSNLDDLISEPAARKRKRIARKKEEKRMDNEYSRIRKNLRYLLNRINYEQSLIAAYSSEGWKGLSVEKLKPEQELQRANKEIVRCKLKIRDLFQHLDATSAEGTLPDSLFDSEGEISGDDIFCAKCGSKDLSADNDIILCDGVCDRGFHQYCLEPPLLKKDIPPDDEGWLCPGCDCKVDCIDLLNDSRGTNLSITDTWEKVFPEATAAAAGRDKDPNLGLPSDDSEDDDYDPDGLEDDNDDDDDDEQNEENESSDESDFTSASDELVPPPMDEEYLGLPSEDSEDYDYDPDALNHDEKDKQESSSSDFTSDFEDLDTVLEDNGFDQNDKVPLLGESSERKSQLHGRKKRFENFKSSILGLDSDQGGFSTDPERQSVERLDYENLSNETYGNVPSSSSDDEDWTEIAAASEKEHDDNNQSEKIRWKSPEANERSHMRISGGGSKDKRKNGGSSKTCPTERSMSSSHRHREAVTQFSVAKDKQHVRERLFRAFQENRYPDKPTKESLARELEMTFQQVDSWFKNTRWSVNHSSTSDGTLVRTVSKKDIAVPKTKNELCKAVTKPITTNSKRTECPDETAAAGCSGDSRVPGSSGRNPTAAKSRKRRRR